MGLIQQTDEKGNERTEEKEQRKGEERDCMKVSAVTKGPVMMCSKSSDRFPEYVLWTINSHKRSSIQPLKHAASDPRLSSRLSAAAGLERQEPQLG